MTRLLLSLGMAFSLAASAWGQGITIQLSGDSQFDFGLGDGTPLVLAPAPGWMPTAPEKLLAMPRVANDLELVDWQRKKLEVVLAEVHKDFRSQREVLAQQLQAATDDEHRERIQKEMSLLAEDLKAELKKQIDDLLLPFQKERLAQIVAQTKLNNNGSSALQSGEFADLLQLSDEQRKQLAEKQEAMQKQLREEIQELRRTRQREVIESVLSKGQLETLKKLVGDDLAPSAKTKQPE